MRFRGWSWNRKRSNASEAIDKKALEDFIMNEFREANSMDSCCAMPGPQPPPPVPYVGVPEPTPTSILERAQQYVRLMRLPLHDLQKCRVLLRIIAKDTGRDRTFLIDLGPCCFISREVTTNVAQIEFIPPDYKPLGPIVAAGLVVRSDYGDLAADLKFAVPQPLDPGDTLKLSATLSFTQESKCRFVGTYDVTRQQWTTTP